MLIALTGLHASGKSYFANNIPHKFGFKVYDKKNIVEQICKEETYYTDYWSWYQQEYNKDPYTMTYKILSKLPLEENVILDAVHSYKEWKIIESIVHDSMIVVITTPEDIRKNRWDNGDKEKDLKRIKYWHSDYKGEKGCLLTQVSWSFNGAASLETNEACFIDLLKFIESEKARENFDNPKVLIRNK